MAINKKTFSMAELKWKEFQDEDVGYYYIHRHINHFEKDDAMTIYKTQKENNYIMMKQRFISNYWANLRVNKKGLELLNAAMSEDEYLAGLDSVILDTLNKRVSSIVKNYNLDEYIEMAYRGLDEWMDNRDIKTNMASLDRLFAAIAVAADILDGKNEDKLTLLCVINDFESEELLWELAAYTRAMVTKYENQPITLKNKKILSMYTSLENLVTEIDLKDVSKATLQGYLRNIFSSQIGEYIISQAVVKAFKLTEEIFEESFTGHETIKMDADNLKKLIELGQKRTTNFKTDNQFPNVKMRFSNIDTNITINLGISTKWYKSDMSGHSSNVSVMTEANLSHRLNQFFSGSEGRYYAYNSMALVNQDGTPYAAFKAAMLARFADMFISGFGNQRDFSQFIVVNGKFYSILQLILALGDHNKGQGSTDIIEGTDPLTMSVVGMSKIADETDAAGDHKSNLAMAYFRSRKQNLQFDELKIAAHFYPNRLANLVPELNIKPLKR